LNPSSTGESSTAKKELTIEAWNKSFNGIEPEYKERLEKDGCEEIEQLKPFFEAKKK